MAKKNISKKDVVCEYAFIAVAMLIISASIYFFLIPSKVVIGSISGLAMVLSEPVSYTHLDVYKRQNGACSAHLCKDNGSGKNADRPPSYKRNEV